MRVSFDREDRCYQFGDEVTGSVSVEATSEVTCSEVGIITGWATHGRGFRDSGAQHTLILSARSAVLQPGQRRLLPFRFPVPNGPVTYRGHLVNVDWYVAAHARTTSGRVYREEQDFLLLGGEPTGKILLGEEAIGPKHIPAITASELPSLAAPPEVRARSSKMRWLTGTARSILSALFYTLFFALVLTGLFNRRPGSYGSTVILIAVAAILLWAWRSWPKVVHRAIHSRLELKDFWLRPDVLRRGGQAHCHFEVGARAAVHIRYIKLSMFCQERATRPVRTMSVTDYYVVQERNFESIHGEDLPAGMVRTFDYALPIDEDAPPTFAATNNRVEWFVKVQVGLLACPDLTETLPVTVLP